MRRTALGIVAVIVLAAGSAHAHHGYANFFMDRTVTIEGEIEEVRWVNPHVLLKVRAAVLPSIRPSGSQRPLKEVRRPRDAWIWKRVNEANEAASKRSASAP